MDFLRDAAKVLACAEQLTIGFRKRTQDRTYKLEKALGIHLAAYFGLCRVMTALISEGEAPNSQDSWGRTPLWYAAIRGQDRIVKTLLKEHNADPNLRHWDDEVPIRMAIP